jgi:hypothetical protein
MSRAKPIGAGQTVLDVMSALGQKQTFAVQKGMSALPPIATAKADFRKRSCLLYPESKDVQCSSACPLWAKSGLMECSKSRPLLDHLVGAAKQ